MLRPASMLAPILPPARDARWRGMAVMALGTALLAGCSGAVPSSKGPSRLPPVRHPATQIPAPQPRPAATLHIQPGLEGVIGVDADTLVRVFGAPRLDIKEEDARKLQWSGVACILDAYLYPPQGGGKPIATYVDTRRGDGREVDRAACVAALKRP
jgi:hypothetical protein